MFVGCDGYNDNIMKRERKKETKLDDGKIYNIFVERKSG